MNTKLILALVLLLLTSSLTQSQILVGYGFKIGAAYSNQDWEYSLVYNSDNEYKWGIDAGAFAEIIEHPYISIFSELHYIQKGFKLTAPITTPENPEGTGEYYTILPSFNYFSIQPLLKYRIQGKTTPYIFAGPRLDVLLSQNNDELRFPDEFNKIDAGLTAGVGIETAFMKFPKLIAEARYSPSFTYAYESEGVKIKNKSFEFLLGIKF